MSLSNDDVKQIAHLARIAVDDTHLADHARNLSDILSFVEAMDEVDTTDVEPMAHPLDMAQRLRPDVVTEDNQRALFQSVAPATEGGLYLVPRVIE